MNEGRRIKGPGDTRKPSSVWLATAVMSFVLRLIASSGSGPTLTAFALAVAERRSRRGHSDIRAATEFSRRARKCAANARANELLVARRRVPAMVSRPTRVWGQRARGPPQQLPLSVLYQDGISVRREARLIALFQQGYEPTCALASSPCEGDPYRGDVCIAATWITPGECRVLAERFNYFGSDQGAVMKRFTFELGDDGDEALEQIRSITGTSSKSEVVRDALALFEVLVDRAKDGQSVFVGSDRSTAAELLMPSLKRASRLAAKPRDSSPTGEGR